MLLICKACCKALFGLYKIKQIRKFLSERTTVKLIHALVASHLDYCNLLLCGVPESQIDRLQKVLNAAARVTQQVPIYRHITPILKSLHWLPIGFELSSIFKAIKGMAPSYLSGVLQAKPTSRFSLRSNNENLFTIPQTRCKTFGDRAFVVTGPQIWNNVPLRIRDTENLDIFKNKLKTHLFKEAFYKRSYDMNTVF